ncbi:putative uncharacterized protein [Mycolicibacterium novocastrense]|uniref:Uncharacterized protein n=1 Tax=Mycolicibacterium novocastrense TaxID=59813 RepID=A0ABQ0KKQ6_MYCNV|nr:putative uncharacterized protein [Mycolicibacterium novocastrense]
MGPALQTPNASTAAADAAPMRVPFLVICTLLSFAWLGAGGARAAYRPPIAGVGASVMLPPGHRRAVSAGLARRDDKRLVP